MKWRINKWHSLNEKLVIYGMLPGNKDISLPLLRCIRDPNGHKNAWIKINQMIEWIYYSCGEQSHKIVGLFFRYYYLWHTSQNSLNVFRWVSSISMVSSETSFGLSVKNLSRQSNTVINCICDINMHISCASSYFVEFWYSPLVVSNACSYAAHL